MHRLVPSLITDNLNKGILQGSLAGATLFVDISGFTVVTETLMQHGQHGAEVLAVVMRTIFAPVVRSVYEQGGFVVNFAGDAITAVFPVNDDEQQEVNFRALAAAWQIQTYMAEIAQTATPYGTFEFSAKVGFAAGEVEWGIILSPGGGRAVYFFKGSAVVGCANAEKHAYAGDIVASESVFEVVGTRVLARRVADHWRITSVLSTLPEPRAIDLSPPDVEQIARFYPRSLVEREIIGEFRQVLNLFVSLQGTPEHAALESFVELVFRLQDKYGGLVNRIDFGDKGCHLVLFWGAPISYENDVTRVLNFILELREVSQIPLRVGITYRIAHAGSVGSPLAQEYTCYGRGVNLAARHMASAGWDEIWVDDETARRAEGAFTFESLGRKSFKGFSDTQPVHLLTGQREDIVSPFADRPLVGRQTELNRLRQAVRPIYDGCFAGVVTVVGEAGIGKSRLVHELLESFAISGEAAVFLCQTDEIIRQSLNPFRYFLRHYFDQSTTRDEAANKRQFEEILEDLLASVLDSSLKNELERTTSFLGSLVGLYWEDSLYEQLDPELRFENSLNALKTLFRAESRRQPVVIQLEDAHWLDADSKQFLGRLARNMVDFPLVLLVTSREELSVDLFDPDVTLEAIHLQTLGKQGLEDMAQAIIHGQPSPALLRLVQERTDGNPFYAEQLLLYLQENDLLDSITDQVDGVLPGDVYIPTDVRALLTARLDRLPSLVKEVVQHAAVLGREFEAPILFDMMAKDPALETKLETAANESVWIALDETRFLFQHALLRDAAYDMQLHSRLLQMHKLAAQAFEKQHQQDPDLSPRFPEIAYHFDKADEKIKASQYYGEAGEQAKENYSNTEAINYFSRGLELADDVDFQSKYSFLCGRETIYQWMGRREAQENDLEQLVELLKMHPNELKQAELALRQSAFALVTGDYDTAFSDAQLSLNYARKANSIEARSKAYHRQGRTLWEQGLATEAESYLLKALNLAREAGRRNMEAEILHDLGVVNRYMAHYKEAKSFLEEAFSAYSELADDRGIVQCQNQFGVIDNELGNLLESQHHYLEALEICRKIGLQYWETHILLNIGNTYFDLGDYQNADKYHTRALALSREKGDFQAMAMSLDTLGLISHYQNEPQSAIALYEQALVINKSIDNQREKGYVLTHLGYALLDTKRYEDAKLKLEQGLQIRNELQAQALAIDSIAGLALVALQTDEISEAIELVTDILSYIKAKSTDGIEQPVLVYLICYRILMAAAINDPSLSGDAQSVLNEGYNILEKRRSLLTNEEMKRRFTREVPYNRELFDAWLISQQSRA